MKNFTWLALAASLLLSVPAYAAGPMPGGTKQVFTTGGEQGTYYAVGGVIAGSVSDKTSTKVVAISSGGSKANIEAIEAGDAQLGFSQTDVADYAYNGKRLFEKTGKITAFSAVANLYMEQVQIVTLNDKIKTVADLKGKVVSVGAAGSGVYFNAVDVLEAYGLDVNKDIKATYQSFGDSSEALLDGKIDAAFIVAGAPTTSVTSLATSRKVNLVSLDDEHIKMLLDKSPYYSRYVVDKSTYNMDSDAQTVAVGALIIADNNASEADIYNFLYGTFDNLPALQSAHAKAKEFNLEFAASFGSFPYHPGAVKYFAEKGVKVGGK
ncbi:MAG: TAXI family TRAP transporter solute-binding subunit [Mailhella sp.]|nr:TAXI family TRAP transporter solute-binding subunit [Mailhella sp.]